MTPVELDDEGRRVRPCAPNMVGALVYAAHQLPVWDGDHDPRLRALHRAQAWATEGWMAAVSGSGSDDEQWWRDVRHGLGGAIDYCIGGHSVEGLTLESEVTR